MKLKENLNYKIYQFSRLLKGRLLSSVPNLLIPKRRELNKDLQIGITTYVDRYESYFKPLYKSLRSIFPEVNIYVAVNGFYDDSVQKKYLELVHKELCYDLKNDNTFILHDKPVGLTRLWNELLSQGQCETTLLLNDDLYIYPWFRIWLGKVKWDAGITLINGTWSHFLFSKSMLKTVGWFDEEYRGIGFEDMDYTARCAHMNISIQNISCQYILHQDHQPTRTSFDKDSDTLWGPKYSQINHDTFFRKWKLSDTPSDIFIKQLSSYILPNQLTETKNESIELSFNGGVCYPDRN